LGEQAEPPGQTVVVATGVGIHALIDQLWLMAYDEPIAAVTVIRDGGFCRGGHADEAGNAGLLITGVETDRIQIGQVITDVAMG
jgi:hypothetical protein